jgi:glycolate oxidase
MNNETKEKLRAIVGEANFTDQLIDLVSFSSDASEHSHRPDAAVWATRSEQVKAIIELANAARFPVIARGAGTGLSGLAVPAKGGLVLDLSRMDKILEINIGDRVAVVEPGVIYDDLDRALAPAWLFFPARSVQRQGLHPGRQRRHQRGRRERRQVRQPPAIMCWASRWCWATAAK